MELAKRLTKEETQQYDEMCRGRDEYMRELQAAGIEFNLRNSGGYHRGFMEGWNRLRALSQEAPVQPVAQNVSMPRQHLEWLARQNENATGDQANYIAGEAISAARIALAAAPVPPVVQPQWVSPRERELGYVIEETGRLYSAPTSVLREGIFQLRQWATSRRSADLTREPTCCWRCSKFYAATTARCPHCNATNANVDLDAAQAEQAQSQETK